MESGTVEWNSGTLGALCTETQCARKFVIFPQNQARNSQKLINSITGPGVV